MLDVCEERGWDSERSSQANEKESLAPRGMDEESYDSPRFPVTSSWKRWGQGRQHYFAQLPALTF